MSLTDSLSNAIDALASQVSGHLPDILLGMSITAGAATTVYGISVTPKAMDDIVEWVMLYVPEEERRGIVLPSEMYKLVPNRIKFKLLWRKYLPVVLGIGLSAGTGIAAETINNNRILSATALATTLSARIEDLKSSAKEVVGPTRYDEIESKAAQKTIDRMQDRKVFDDKENTYYVNRRTEGFKIIDDITQRIFVVDIDQLMTIQNKLNDRLRAWDWVPLNDLYEELTVAPSAVGNDIGWDSRDGKITFAHDYRGGKLEGVPVGVFHLADQLSIRLPGNERLKFRR